MLSSVISLAYFNPRSPCGERHVAPENLTLINISIHAPRVGSDRHDGYIGGWSSISIHAPRVGSDGRRH